MKRYATRAVWFSKDIAITMFSALNNILFGVAINLTYIALIALAAVFLFFPPALLALPIASVAIAILASAAMAIPLYALTLVVEAALVISALAISLPIAFAADLVTEGGYALIAGTLGVIASAVGTIAGVFTAKSPAQQHNGPPGGKEFEDPEEGSAAYGQVAMALRDRPPAENPHRRGEEKTGEQGPQYQPVYPQLYRPAWDGMTPYEKFTELGYSLEHIFQAKPEFFDSSNPKTGTVLMTKPVILHEPLHNGTVTVDETNVPAGKNYDKFDDLITQMHDYAEQLKHAPSAQPGSAPPPPYFSGQQQQYRPAYVAVQGY